MRRPPTEELRPDRPEWRIAWENHVLRALLAFCVVLLATSLCKASGPGRLEGSRLTLTNESGSIVFDIAPSPKGGALVSVFDEDGTHRVVLGYERGGSVLALLDKSLKSRISISMEDSGIPHLAMRDSEGRERLRMCMAETGDATIEILAPDGSVKWHAP